MLGNSFLKTYLHATLIERIGLNCNMSVHVYESGIRLYYNSCSVVDMSHIFAPILLRW